MNVTLTAAGLLAGVTFTAGIFVGAGLVAFALARREASLNAWAAALQRRERQLATDPSPGPDPIGPTLSEPSVWPASPDREIGARSWAYRWPVLPETTPCDDLASFLASTGQFRLVPDMWR